MQVNFKNQRSGYIFIITGNPGCGKTTFLGKLVKILMEKGISVTGFLAPVSSTNLQSKSYLIQNIETGERLPLASGKFIPDWIRVGNFFFNPEAIQAGDKILNKPELQEYDLIIIDEIGPFELKDKIWAASVSRLLSLFDATMIWVVRKSLIQDVIRKWNLEFTEIIDVRFITLLQAEKMIISVLK